MWNIYRLRLIFVLFCVTVLFSAPSHAQVMNWQEHHRGSIYFSIGYNKQWFANSTIHITQGQNSTYDLQQVAATDQGSSNNPYSILHYNFRVGYILNYNQSIGIEFAYDPSRYYIPENQQVHILGTFDGNHVDNNLVFSNRYGLNYNLNDGMGTMVLNFVKRYGLYRKVSHKFALDIIGKCGMGVVMPGVAYNLGGFNPSPGSGIAGLDYDAEIGLKWLTHRHIYLELSYRFDYASLNNIQLTNGGSATQDIISNKVSLNLGYTFSLTPHNPIFAKGWPHRKEIKHPRPMYRTEEDY